MWYDINTGMVGIALSNVHVRVWFKYIYHLHSEQHFSFFHRLHLGEEAWKLRNARTDPADIPQFSHVTSTSNSLRGDNTAIGYTAINDNHVEGVL